MANREKASTRKKSGSATARRSGPVKKSDAATRGGPAKKSAAAKRSGAAAKSGAARAGRPVKKGTAARVGTTAKKTGPAAAARGTRESRRRRAAGRAVDFAARRRTGLADGSAKQSLIREVQDAVDRARDWLGARGDYYAFLSRSDTLRGAPELGRHLRGDLLAKQGRDGSWGDGSLAASTEAIWQLLDMGTSPDFHPLARALDWLYGQLDADGSFASGCTPARHEQGICEHFLQGFFSPGRPNDSVAVDLPNGQSIAADATARLLASQRALRSALRANPRDPRLAAAVDGLTSLPLYDEYGGAFTPAVLVGAVQALAWHPSLGAVKRDAGLATLAAAQQKNGDWPNVEFFFVLEALLEARHPLSDRMLRGALTKLLDSRHSDGTWGRRHAATQTWIAVQVLERIALKDPRSGPGSSGNPGA